VIDFDIAKTWHKLFAEHLELVAHGIIDEELSEESACDDGACKLGKWLDGPAHAMSSLPSYSDLRIHHRHFHQCACDLLRIARDATHAGARNIAITNFRTASATVIETIDRLIADHAALATLATDDRPDVAASPAGEQSARPHDSWNEAMSTGVATIDDHHKAIVTILDKMASASDLPVMSELANDALTDLGRILQLHFAVEETYLKKCGMPEEDLAEHLREHYKILEQYAEINFQAMTQGQMRIKDISATVKAWAVDHVMAYDLAIRNYLPLANSASEI
jgi:hemerythrin